jgi:transcriptional regulator with XRE-family HTH domain
VYTLTKRKNARDLFVETGMRYEDVARKTGISASLLKRWGGKEEWMAQRNTYERDVTALNEKILRAISSVVDKLSTAYEKGGAFFSQDIFAHEKAIESLVIAAAYTGKDLKQVFDAIEILNKNRRPALRAPNTRKARGQGSRTRR